MRDPFEKTTIVLEIETCQECPMCKSHRTLNAGYALDYYCTHPSLKNYVEESKNRPAEAVGRKVMGYVEYSNDESPVPVWCPLIKNYALEIADDILLGHVEDMRKEIDTFNDYLADLRNKYGRLHTYWQLMNLEKGYQFAKPNLEELKEVNAEFVKLLKFTGNSVCSRECNSCLQQCNQKSFLIKREI